MQRFKQVTNTDDNIICAYLYGSQVYGTYHEGSDYDFICIVKDKSKNNPLAKFGDITNYTVEEFQMIINNHEISALECIFLANEYVVKNNHQFQFELDKSALRNSISAKSSNSWVKCKKKFLVEADYNPYVGKKSAWHALRILDFGTQIGTHGKIVDFSSVNWLFPEVMKLNSWEEIEAEYKKTYNNFSSAFKLVAPKEENQLKIKKP